MKKRRDSQPFSMSFLDILTCALGGVLLLLLLMMSRSHRQASAFRLQIDSMEQQMSDARKAVADAIQEIARHESAKQSLERAQSALIGFKGEFGGVVFIFDTSGSMKSGRRFSECQQLLKQWLRYLPFTRFNVVDFDNSAEAWRSGSLANATEAERESACTFVDNCSADGGTNTLAALKIAFEMPGADTIILMSDGAPDQEMDEIHEWLNKANRNHHIAINCVGIGNYFHGDYGPFLQKIASDHEGMFIGR